MKIERRGDLEGKFCTSNYKNRSKDTPGRMKRAPGQGNNRDPS